MKKLIHLSIGIFAIAAMGLSSCSKAITADYTLDDMNTCMSPTTLGQHAQIATFTVDHNKLVSAINSAGAKDVSRVTTAKLKQITAAVTTAGDNFDKLSDVEVYFKTANDLNDSVQIAYYVFKPGDTQIALNLNGAELKAAVNYDPIFIVKILNGNNSGTSTCVKLTQGIVEMNIQK